MTSKKRVPDPTPEEIAERAAEVQRQWSEQERANRRCSQPDSDPAVMAQATPPAPETTILQLMVEDITQDSDIIWGIEDPQTDEDWQVFEDAAVRLIESFNKIETGLAGPNDKSWAADEKFRAYIEQEYAALDAIRKAVASRNLDGVFDAGGELYMPCEECHLDFNPAVVNQEQH